jgi:hypothetical protein
MFSITVFHDLLIEERTVGHKSRLASIYWDLPPPSGCKWNGAFFHNVNQNVQLGMLMSFTDLLVGV